MYKVNTVFARFEVFTAVRIYVI